MTQPSLRLYVDAKFLSPYAMSVFVALREKGLPCALQTVDLAGGAQHGAAFAATSLTRRVPTLVHEDFALPESTAIAEYLEDVFPGVALYPRDARSRARARQVQAWLRSDLAALRSERPTDVVFQGARRAALSEAAQAAADKLVAVCETLLPQGADTLFGAWCIADTDLALMLQRLAQHGDALPARLAAYAQAQWQRPAVQEWLALGRAA